MNPKFQEQEGVSQQPPERLCHHVLEAKKELGSFDISHFVLHWYEVGCSTECGARVYYVPWKPGTLLIKVRVLEVSYCPTAAAAAALLCLTPKQAICQISPP